MSALLAGGGGVAGGVVTLALLLALRFARRAAGRIDPPSGSHGG